MKLNQIFSIDTFYILSACVLAYVIFFKFLKNQIWAWKHADCLPMIPQDSPESEFANDFSCLASMMGKAKTRSQMNRYFDRIYEVQEKYQGYVDGFTLAQGIDNLIEIYEKQCKVLMLN